MTTTTERIAELTAAREEGANYGELPEYHVRASDYALSEDDWRAYLSDDEAAEIVALIERQAENQERAERIAARIADEYTDRYAADTYPGDELQMVRGVIEEAATAAALQAVLSAAGRALKA